MGVAEKQSDALPEVVKVTGWKPGKKKGWKGLTKGHYIAYQSGAGKELSIAAVLFNDRNNLCVEAHQCRTVWSGARIQHLKEYRKYDADGSGSTAVAALWKDNTVWFANAGDSRGFR